MMSRRKPAAALAAVIAVLAVAVPAASASVATASPTVPTASFAAGRVLLPPGSLPCQILINQIRTALLFGNPVLANFYSIIFIYSGCGGAAI